MSASCKSVQQAFAEDFAASANFVRGVRVMAQESGWCNVHLRKGWVVQQPRVAMIGWISGAGLLFGKISRRSGAAVSSLNLGELGP